MVSKAARAALAAAFVSSAVSMPVLERRTSGINVELAKVSDTEVTATVTNTADEVLSFLNYGTFMDDDVVQKVTVSQSGSIVPFTGILRNYHLEDLPEDAFTTLAPGETFSTKINLPAVHAMQDGGDFDILSLGALPFASAGSTKLTGAIDFESNKIAMSIAPEVAKSVKSLVVAPAKQDKRTTIQNCSGSQGTALTTALANAAKLSAAAATAATSGDADKFQEYYKTTSSSVRSTVAARFQGVVREASSNGTSKTTYSCTDDRDACTSGVLAYTYPSLNHIANCPLYYSALPALTSSCHRQDQATTSLHEFTHAPGTYSPGTDDNGYGYQAATSLSSSAAVLNADTYALYANAIYVGC